MKKRSLVNRKKQQKIFLLLWILFIQATENAIVQQRLKGLFKRTSFFSLHRFCSMCLIQAKKNTI